MLWGIGEASAFGGVVVLTASSSSSSKEYFFYEMRLTITINIYEGNRVQRTVAIQEQTIKHLNCNGKLTQGQIFSYHKKQHTLHKETHKTTYSRESTK